MSHTPSCCIVTTVTNTTITIAALHTTDVTSGPLTILGCQARTDVQCTHAAHHTTSRWHAAQQPWSRAPRPWLAD